MTARGFLGSEGNAQVVCTSPHGRGWGLCVCASHHTSKAVHKEPKGRGCHVMIY